MARIYNFSAGPATLPVPVLEEAAKAVVEIAGSGMSILELSHRGKIYETLHNEARANCLKLMGLDPAEYTVIFMGGGASTQFAVVPMNFLPAGKTADYVDGGEWGKKAIETAQKLGTVNIAASSAAQKHMIGLQRAKITSATAISPWPEERPSFQAPG